MEIIITGLHLEVTDAIKEYAEEKVSKISKYLENITSVKITLEVRKTKSEGNIHIAKAIARTPGKEIVIESEDANLYSAIDLLSDKLERQVRKYKEKMKDRSY